MIDVDEGRLALDELRGARRRNHREAVHWVDALYRVYVTALGSAIVVVIGSGWLGDEPVDATRLAAEGPAWLGAAFAVMVGLGLRSGGRGGPLALEAPTVQHELLAPIDLGTALRGPAIKQLRFMAFTGLLVGGCVGVLAARRVVANPTAIVAGCAAAFSLACIASVAAAMFISGRRLGIWAASAIAFVLLTWSAIDVALHITTSPLTFIASIAFSVLQVPYLAIIGVAAVGALVAGALNGIGNTSVESARRRAGLVSQLRFAVTLQDIRTVVLIRRQLSQELPRSHPWIRMRPSGRLPATWRRDWQSYLRYPGARVMRMVLLAAVAGLALGFTWRGTPAAFLVAAFALFLAGYDAVEPIAQEIDHPSRWAALGDDYGRGLLLHLPAALCLMVIECALASAVSLTMVPASVVSAVFPVVILPVAAAATLGATLGTVLSGATSSSLLDMEGMSGMDLQAMGMDSTTMGFATALRLALPPGIAVAALAPVLRAGHVAEAVDPAKISNSMTPAIVLMIGVVLYIRFRRPSRL